MNTTATLDASDSGRRDVEDLQASPESEGGIDCDPVVLEAKVDTDLYSEVIALCRERLSRADRILLLIQDDRVMEIKESYGSKAAFVIMKEEISQAIIRRVRRKQRAIFISDALADEELGARQSIKKIGQRSVLCAPIVCRGKTIGIVYADSISLVGAFTESEMRWSIRLTTALGKALATAKKGAATPAADPESVTGKRIPIKQVLLPWLRTREDMEEDRLEQRRFLSALPRPTGTDKAVFLRSLACMLSSGFPVYAALDLLSQTGSTLAPYSSKMAEDVGKGYPLSAALSRFPKLFGKDFLKLIAVGENSGTLDMSMLTLAEAEENQMVLRGKVIAALTYPAVVLSACVLGCLLAPPLFLNDFFESLAQANSNLPWLTQAVMAVSKALWNPLFWLVLGVVLVGLKLGWRSIRKKRDVMINLELFLVDFGFIGDTYRDIVVLKFVRALRLQLDAGLYLDRSLKLAGEASGSYLLHREAEVVVERLLAGETFGFALERSSFFPKTLVEFIHVGEETGQLSTMCGFVESLLASRTESSIDTAQTLIEPLAMSVVGILVGTVALACLLPLVQMVQSFI